MYTCEACGFRDSDWDRFANVRIGYYEYSGRKVCKDQGACLDRVEAKKAEDAAWCRAERGAE